MNLGGPNRRIGAGAAAAATEKSEPARSRKRRFALHSDPPRRLPPQLPADVCVNLKHGEGAG